MENNVKLSTQQARVLEYMKTFGGITALQAVNDLGILRVSSRISELTQKGFRINKKRISVNNRFKEQTTVILYTLGEENNK